jgi:hypothetical protein
MADLKPNSELHRPSGAQRSDGGSSHERSTSTHETDLPTNTTTTRDDGDHVSSDTEDDDDDNDEEEDYDGYRPTRLDIRRSRSRAASSTTTATTATGAASQQRPGTGSAGGGGLRRTTTILSRIRSRPQPGLPQFTHPLSHVPTGPDFLVDFDGPLDPYKPMNWPLKKKIITTFLYGTVTMTATWASSCYSAGTAQIAPEFRVGSQVAVLGTSLFLVGFGVGPLLWAPLSEVYGRRLAVLPPMFVAACFSFGSATAKDFQTLMLTRFWGAFFASAPVTNTGGVLGDLFGPAQRGIAMAGYAMAVVAGPALGMFSGLTVLLSRAFFGDDTWGLLG